MERRNSQEWIKSLKIAIINKDMKKLELYSSRKVPDFTSLEEANEALSLINQAVNILKVEKTEIGKKLNALKQSKKFNMFTNTSTFSFQA